MAKRNTLQDDLNYHQAKRSLRALMSTLDLAPHEQTEFETDLQDLQVLIQKLEQEIIYIAAFGLVGRGKSSLLNALIGYEAFATGPTHGITQSSQRAPWIESWDPSPEAFRSVRPYSAYKPDVYVTTVSGLSGSRLELIDTPGLDEVNGQVRSHLAHRVARQADLILFVVSGDMTRVEYEALAELREAGKPMILVFNKVDQYPEVDRVAVYDKIRHDRVKELLSPAEVVMASASPRIARPIYTDDGSIKVALEPGPPMVDELRTKLFDVLNQEGRSLIALNTLLFADQVQQAIIAHKFKSRDDQAQALLWNAARAKAIAVALNPLTFVDSISAAVIDVTLISKLAQLYGLPLTTEGSIQLLQRIIVGMVSLGLGEWVAMMGLGSLKTLLSAVTPITAGFGLGAYVSVALTQATIAGMSCYAVGTAAKVYLANGASWGSGGPKRVIAQILDQLDENSITSRIRQELQTQLQYFSMATD